MIMISFDNLMRIIWYLLLFLWLVILIPSLLLLSSLCFLSRQPCGSTARNSLMRAMHSGAIRWRPWRRKKERNKPWRRPSRRFWKKQPQPLLPPSSQTNRPRALARRNDGHWHEVSVSISSADTSQQVCLNSEQCPCHPTIPASTWLYNSWLLLMQSVNVFHF